MSTVTISVRSIGCKPIDVDVSPDVQVIFPMHCCYFLRTSCAQGVDNHPSEGHACSHASHQVAELRAIIGQKLAFPPDRLKLVQDGHPLLDMAGRAKLQHGGALSSHLAIAMFAHHGDACETSRLLCHERLQAESRLHA